MMRDTPVVVLAGGKGTRLAPYTTTFPKPLMPIDDMPVLEIVLRQLRECGFRRVVISVGHLAELIMAFFGKGEKWGLDIEYAIEDDPLGTIGPLRIIEGLDKPFIVMNGDLLTDIDYRALVEHHLHGPQIATIASYRRTVTISFGVLTSDEGNRITGFEEKPSRSHFVSMGIYSFDPYVMKYIPAEGKYGFDDLMRDMLADGQDVREYPFDGLWLDIGRPEDYEAAVGVFRSQRERFLRETRTQELEP